MHGPLGVVIFLLAGKGVCSILHTIQIIVIEIYCIGNYRLSVLAQTAELCAASVGTTLCASVRGK